MTYVVEGAIVELEDEDAFPLVSHYTADRRDGG